MESLAHSPGAPGYAKKWVRRSHFESAMEFFEGKNGKERDLRKGADELKKAGQLELAEAQVELGKAYQQALYGFARDDAEAVKWHSKAADQGHAEGQYWLGFAYLHGLGVAKDNVQAAQLFRISAKQGFTMAKDNLIFIEARKNLEQAQQSFAQAQQRLAQAQLSVGRCYLEGRGVKRDVAEANRLLQLAGVEPQQLQQQQQQQQQEGDVDDLESQPENKRARI